MSWRSTATRGSSHRYKQPLTAPSARRSGRPRHGGKLVVQPRRSIGGDRVNAEGSGSRGRRGFVDRPGRDAETTEPQALD